MSESGDFDPGPWRGKSDFKAASKQYDEFANRAYNEAQKAGKTISDLLPRLITSYAENLSIIAIDTTASMGEAPRTIFGKLPYLDIEGQQYLGRDAETCLGSIGDARSEGESKEKYPIQYRPFAKGLDIEKSLKELVPEKKGGGSSQESYELAALYAARNIETPNAKRPIYIIIGDEQPYPFVEPPQARQYAYVDLDRKLPTQQVFDELQEKFSVFLIRRAYSNPMVDTSIYENWKRLLGGNRIAYLLDDTRVVDIIFGLLAKETNKVDYFWEEISERQTPAQVNLVERCLEPVIGRRSPRTTASSTSSRPLV